MSLDLTKRHLMLTTSAVQLDMERSLDGTRPDCDISVTQYLPGVTPAGLYNTLESGTLPTLVFPVNILCAYTLVSRATNLLLTLVSQHFEVWSLGCYVHSPTYRNSSCSYVNRHG